MSAHDSDETAREEQATDIRNEQGTGDPMHEHSDDIELSEEGRKKVDDMIEAYKDNRRRYCLGRTAR